jgi:DNA-binding NarL/FixJ family response regulator
VSGVTPMRVVIAEDAAVMRDGLARLLEDRGHSVVAAVGDADALLEAVAQHQPDVAVVDIRMPPTHTDEGLRAAITLRRDQPGVAVLMFSQYVETRYASQLLAENPAGVGYLLKDRVADVREFVDALSRVVAGGTALDPDVVGQLMSASRRGATLDDTLTAREGEVLALMAEGRSNGAIAERLVVSQGAVEKHVANIFLKLGSPCPTATTAESSPSSATSTPDLRLRGRADNARAPPPTGRWSPLPVLVLATSGR